MLKDESKRVNDMYFILVQAALFSNVGITAKELAACLEVSDNTLRRMLRDFPQCLLITDKSEKEYHYLMDLNELDKLYPASD